MILSVRSMILFSGAVAAAAGVVQSFVDNMPTNNLQLCNETDALLQVSFTMIKLDGIIYTTKMMSLYGINLYFRFIHLGILETLPWPNQ